MIYSSLSTYKLRSRDGNGLAQSGAATELELGLHSQPVFSTLYLHIVAQILVNAELLLNPF